jgi:hypothetical protein
MQLFLALSLHVSGLASASNPAIYPFASRCLGEGCALSARVSALGHVAAVYSSHKSP